MPLFLHSSITSHISTQTSTTMSCFIFSLSEFSSKTYNTCMPHFLQNIFYIYSLIFERRIIITSNSLSLVSADYVHTEHIIWPILSRLILYSILCAVCVKYGFMILLCAKPGSELCARIQGSRTQMSIILVNCTNRRCE